MVTQRLRDPIHNLIVFRKDDEEDQLVWRLIGTKEFQRLRRIRQLGLSEFVFPGATHTRFAHSIGVFNNARRLLSVLENTGKHITKEQRRVILVSALLHDVGHGPFSHAFEVAREAIAESRGEEAIHKHERWSANQIRQPGGDIQKELGDELAAEVAGLIAAEEPRSVLDAVVSSSFDADRLDYVVRDRYMTGAGAGAIDQEWLIDNLRTYEVSIPQDDDKPRQVPTFVFGPKGRQAAEDFLLARYRLYSQIYLHKTTRGFEQLVTALFQYIGGEHSDLGRLGLRTDDPLVVFLRTLDQAEDDHQKTDLLRKLDDTFVWAMIGQLSECEDDIARDLSSRLIYRKPLKVIDLSARFVHNDNDDALINAQNRIEQELSGKIGNSVFLDAPTLNLYSRIGGESAKEHKKVRALNGNGEALELPEFPDSIISKELTKKRKLVRFYFLSEEEKEIAEKLIRGR
jgi:HD superfamily phosphohydrolase